jgi:pimeloyl-ACP methyl ester carboxylesterase
MNLVTLSTMIFWRLFLLIILWGETTAQERNDTLFLPNPFGDTQRELSDTVEAAFLSTLVYQLDETNYLDKVPAPYTPLRLWDSGSTDALFTRTQDRIFLVFRGTDESEDGDWATNLDLLQDVFGPPEGPIVEGVIYDNRDGELEAWNIRVHEGFNTALFSQSLFDVASDILLDFDTVWICGHSLGGANSQLFGTYFAYRYPEVNTYVTTFGSPRIGNYGFKVWADSLKNLNVWRFVNRRDLVPRTPSTNYDHAGHIMWKEPCEGCDGPVVAHYRQTGDPEQGYEGIGSAGFTLCKSIRGEIELCVTHPSLIKAILDAVFIAARGNESITDHYMVGYNEWLQFAELDPSTNYTCGFEGASDTQCARSTSPPTSSTQYVGLTCWGTDLIMLIGLASHLWL